MMDTLLLMKQQEHLNLLQVHSKKSPLVCMVCLLIIMKSMTPLCPSLVEIAVLKIAILTLIIIIIFLAWYVLVPSENSFIIHKCRVIG
mmetsp:Transcript_5998/g.6892  ORF Transcript_5998/g.6892 Transcript_5998/m.6892 type:complete len:88 (-) Transcript_5998:60-323(-)